MVGKRSFDDADWNVGQPKQPKHLFPVENQDTHPMKKVVPIENSLIENPASDSQVTAVQQTEFHFEAVNEHQRYLHETDQNATTW